MALDSRNVGEEEGVGGAAEQEGNLPTKAEVGNDDEKVKRKLEEQGRSTATTVPAEMHFESCVDLVLDRCRRRVNMTGHPTESGESYVVAGRSSVPGSFKRIKVERVNNARNQQTELAAQEVKTGNSSNTAIAGRVRRGCPLRSVLPEDIIGVAEYNIRCKANRKRPYLAMLSEIPQTVSPRISVSGGIHHVASDTHSQSVLATSNTGEFGENVPAMKQIQDPPFGLPSTDHGTSPCDRAPMEISQHNERSEVKADGIADTMDMMETDAPGLPNTISEDLKDKVCKETSGETIARGYGSSKLVRSSAEIPKNASHCERMQDARTGDTLEEERCAEGVVVSSVASGDGPAMATLNTTGGSESHGATPNPGEDFCARTEERFPASRNSTEEGRRPFVTNPGTEMEYENATIGTHNDNQLDLPTRVAPLIQHAGNFVDPYGVERKYINVDAVRLANGREWYHHFVMPYGSTLALLKGVLGAVFKIATEAFVSYEDDQMERIVVETDCDMVRMCQMGRRTGVVKMYVVFM